MCVVCACVYVCACFLVSVCCLCICVIYDVSPPSHLVRGYITSDSQDSQPKVSYCSRILLGFDIIDTRDMAHTLTYLDFELFRRISVRCILVLLTALKHFNYQSPFSWSFILKLYYSVNQMSLQLFTLVIFGRSILSNGAV